MSRPPLPRFQARCRAISLTKNPTRPFRRCDNTEVLEHGYCRDHAYPPSAIQRYAAMWMLLGDDWEGVQEGITLADLPAVKWSPSAATLGADPKRGASREPDPAANLPPALSHLADTIRELNLKGWWRDR